VPFCSGSAPLARGSRTDVVSPVSDRISSSPVLQPVVAFRGEIRYHAGSVGLFEGLWLHAIPVDYSIMGDRQIVLSNVVLAPEILTAIVPGNLILRLEGDGGRGAFHRPLTVNRAQHPLGIRQRSGTRFSAQLSREDELWLAIAARYLQRIPVKRVRPRGRQSPLIGRLQALDIWPRTAHHRAGETFARATDHVSVPSSILSIAPPYSLQPEKPPVLSALTSSVTLVCGPGPRWWRRPTRSPRAQGPPVQAAGA
jgi:hypothetical protein